jgi:hypothetical protein
MSGEAGGRNPDPHLDLHRTPRRRQYPGARAPVDSAQPIEDEERLPGPLRLDRGADPLKSAQQPLGQLAGLNRVGKRGIGDQDTGDLHTNVCSYRRTAKVKDPRKF